MKNTKVPGAKKPAKNHSGHDDGERALQTKGHSQGRDERGSPGRDEIRTQTPRVSAPRNENHAGKNQ